MALQLSSEPALGSMVITTGGVWDYTYRLGGGLTFPAGTESTVKVTNRAGATEATITGEVLDNKIRFLAQPSELTAITEGANFEQFITVDDGTYKVRYGRVVFRNPSYPLLTNTFYDPFADAVYDDDLNRAALGPRWISKYGATAMHPHDGGSPDYLMGVRSIDFFLPFTLWQDSAVLWYAPTQTNSFEIKISLWAGGNAKTTLAFCSNYAMTNYLGVQFDGTGTDAVRVVTGSGPITTTNISAWTHTVASGPDPYVIRYNSEGNGKIEVWADTAATGAADLTYTVPAGRLDGEGFRYLGFNWQSSFAATGPLVGAFSVETIDGA